MRVIALIVLVTTTLAAQSAAADSATPGGRIAFVIVGPAQSSSDIGVVNVDGTNRRNLTRTGAPYESWPAWSPDGRRIGFITQRNFFSEDLAGDLAVMNADGRARRQLTRRHRYFGPPRWSPDGRRLMFITVNSTVSVVRADGTGLRKLAGNAWAAAWSPDGRRIAFLSWRSFFGPYSFLSVIDADGRGRRQFARFRHEVSGLAWTAADRIVYDGIDGLYSVTSDGRGRRLLRGTKGGDPSLLAPDGTLLAVGGSGLAVVDVATGRRR